MEPVLVTNSSPSDKKNNLKRFNNSPVVTSNKISNFMIQSRSPSPPDLSKSNNNITPKPNQVSNVVLYGIPIVSLYIENQERLCLAQISNTLLKQFSYNEIHNRRVALGITCVQCTPVQLEILRRAGAMPVSSRRCGMITRREAERLCKSFLGDNSPPRLPDDFSFSVFHECAWGCRGNFLPSRYNSSRAKCIKCSFCALFFSPNKFIFHSHRLSPNDKYVQPDAANFNSWRRHLKLSGSPPENVMHAWEDVKAMFNGGTRKRLMSSPITQSSSSSVHNSKSESSCSRRSKDVQISQYPLRPIHHHNAANNSSANSQTAVTSSVNQITPMNTATPPSPMRSSSSTTTTSTFSQELPFSLSRSFMIDYMWQQTQSTSMNTSTVANKGNFQFPPYSALNWIKQQPSTFLFKPNSNSIAPLNASTTATTSSSITNDEKPPAFNHFHSAAFKPVINMRLANDETNNINASSITTNAASRNHSPTSSSTSSNYNHTTASSSANLSDDEQMTPVKKFMNRKRIPKQMDCDFNVNENSNQNENKIFLFNGNRDDNNDDDYDDDDENEVVDIETTEDDVQILNLQPFRSSSSVIEDEEEIDVSDDKLMQTENNNNLLTSYNETFLSKNKNPIKSLKEIVNRNERHIDDNSVTKKTPAFHSSSSSSPPNSSNKEWTLNFKKESNKYESPSSSSLSYVHKIHGASSKAHAADGSPTKLWSVARLSLGSLESNVSSYDDDSLRTSFYQQLNQIQHKSFIQQSNE